MRIGLMNFINQPSAGSPLIQRSPVGMGGMSSAGPGATGSYAGPGSRQEPDLLTSLGIGLAMTQPTHYSRSYPNTIGQITQGLGYGLQLHQQAKQQHAAAGLEWQKLQAQLEESALRRDRLRYEMRADQQTRTAAAQARQSRLDVLSTDTTLSPSEQTAIANNDDLFKNYMERKSSDDPAARASRRAFLQQDPNLTPEAVAVMERGGPAYEEWIKNKHGDQPVTWGPPSVETFGGKQLLIQRNSRGEVNILEDDLTSGDGDEIINLEKSRKMMDSDGNHPPPGTRMSDALDAGFKPVTTGEANRRTALRGAREVIEGLRDSMLSEEPYMFVDEDNMNQRIEKGGLAWGNQAGPWDQTVARAKDIYQSYSQSDPRYSLYNSYSQGTVVPIVRSLGEVGNLSQTEIEKGLNLIPKATDTPAVSRDKIKRLDDLMKSWIEKGNFEDTAEVEDLEALISALE